MLRGDRFLMGEGRSLVMVWRGDRCFVVEGAIIVLWLKGRSLVCGSERAIVDLWLMWRSLVYGMRGDLWLWC